MGALPELFSESLNDEATGVHADCLLPELVAGKGKPPVSKPKGKPAKGKPATKRPARGKGAKQ